MSKNTASVHFRELIVVEASVVSWKMGSNVDLRGRNPYWEGGMVSCSVVKSDKRSVRMRSKVLPSTLRSEMGR